MHFAGLGKVLIYFAEGDKAKVCKGGGGEGRCPLILADSRRICNVRTEALDAVANFLPGGEFAVPMSQLFSSSRCDSRCSKWVY